MRSIARAFALFVCCLLVLGAFAVAALIALKYGDVSESRGCYTGGECVTMPFDSVEWGTYGTLSQPVRLWMVDDLLTNVGVTSQSRAWVDENLGTPDAHEELSAQCDYVYWLGPKPALITVDELYLCLTFAGDAVATTTVVED